MADILEPNRRDNIANQAAGAMPPFAITNFAEDVALDCNATSDQELARVLSTLIRELIRRGIVHGTVA